MFKQFILRRFHLLALLLAVSISFTHAAAVTLTTYSASQQNSLNGSLADSAPGKPTTGTPSGDTVIEEDPDPPPLSSTFSSPLIIKALYPGDSKDNLGEFIELYKMVDGDLDLSGYQLRYTNGSGNSSIIWEFAEGTILAGKTLVLRYAKAPDASASDAIYALSLARTAGPLELLLDGEPVDSVCWTGKAGCVTGYKTGESSSLVRNLTDGSIERLADYQPDYDATGAAVIWPAPPPEDPESSSTDETADALSARCQGLEFTEVYAYYAEAQAEQFIELYNTTSQPIDTTNCSLSYKNKNYALSGIIQAGQYRAFYPTELGFSITKNPASTNSITLIDADTKVVDELVYIHGQKKSTSYALIYTTEGEALWETTYARTPDAENIYQKFRTCEAGKVINEATGNCVKATNLNSTVQDCPEGKYRNPLTGRCKNIESESTLKDCAEGYERNPETNRCRKIATENDGASYALVPSTASSGKSFIALGMVSLIVSVGTIYIILQYRLEIVRVIRKLRQRFHRVN